MTFKSSIRATCLAILLIGARLFAANVTVNPGSQQVPIVSPPPSLSGNLANATFIVLDLGVRGGSVSFKQHLGSLDGMGVMDINNSGQIVGTTDDFDVPNYTGFLWQNGRLDLAPPLPATDASHAERRALLAINDHGDIVGYSVGVTTFDPATFTSSTPTDSTLWRRNSNQWNAEMMPLIPGRGGWSPLAINNHRQVVGPLGANSSINSDPIFYESGNSRVLPNPYLYSGAHPVGSVFHLNNSGVAVGRILRGQGFQSAIFACYWDAAGIHLLPNDGVDAEAYAINDLNQIVGYARDSFSDLLDGPVLWDGASRVALNPLLAYGAALDINNNGEIVGWSYVNINEPHAVLWSNLQPIDLNSRISPDSGWVLWEARAINDRGQIVGVGTLNGQLRSFLLTPAALAVDANRDGLIGTTGGSALDATSAAAPYRFWLNDDIDRIHTFRDSAADTMGDINETEQDDIGPTEAATNNWQADWKDNVANSRRDLEDFSRIVVSTSGIATALKNGELYLGLKWTVTTGTPAVKLYKQHDAAGDTSYLTDEFKASLQQSEPAILNARYPSDDPVTSTRTLVEPGELFVLPQGVWLGLSDDTLKRTLLFEGCKAGKGQLKLVIVKREGSNYTEVGEGTGVWVDLRSIGDMYEHWSVGNASGGPPDAVAGRTVAEGGSGTFSYTAASPEEQKYILFVHGWNMEKWEKERFAETAYKRLWWQGYKGRFGLFSWPCTNRFDETSTLGKIIEGVTDGTHFDRGEWTAWRTGAPMRQLLQTLNSAYSGELYVFSHSMGGIVVNEALRKQSDAGGAKIAKVYVASQAAFSAHLFDGTLSEAVGSPNAVQWTYNHPSLPTGTRNYGPQTTNIYRNWFAFMLTGGGNSTSAVGTLVNFYNGNDWALAAPAWQFNQITKPDWPDNDYGQPWQYAYAQDAEIFGDHFQKTDGTVDSNPVPLYLGDRADPKNRHEIMSFVAEARVKAFGATPHLTQGVTGSLNLRSIWPANGGDHKAHTWHSAQFRSTIQSQKDYWKTLLDQPGFQIPTTTLP